MRVRKISLLTNPSPHTCFQDAINEVVPRNSSIVVGIHFAEEFVQVVQLVMQATHALPGHEAHVLPLLPQCPRLRILDLSCLIAANLLFLPPAAGVPAEEGVGVDVTKRKLPRGQSLSRSAPGEVSRGGVVLMGCRQAEVRPPARSNCSQPVKKNQTCCSSKLIQTKFMASKVSCTYLDKPTHEFIQQASKVPKASEVV
ncbi:hypothetical protein E2C01_001294 [Portunus trituberculatus]|uniref:Uncharacterized protein n=1 Tax=Portunus trituberculatus TaxID=210409 RepID=A0A5B7CIX7_PORTR|nr:hypothetical protein [Portunus trituberculatus]